MSEKSTPANEAYIRSAERTIAKYKNRELDDVTHKPVTKETAEAAKFGKEGFKAAERLKKMKGIKLTP